MIATGTAEVDQAEVAAFARERDEAAARAQQAPEGATATPPATGHVAAPAMAAPKPPITRSAHDASIEALCGMLVMAGGRPIDDQHRAMAAELTFPAAQKYGGEIPYFVEIAGVVGLGMLVKLSFFPPPAPAAAQPTREAA